ncbi:olfactory receptor 52K1-like [Brachionichthys hirsutus]|uniref:olfactory receptor 52K1-like n=1 Tax=Brachionichthys hirsutus TaxID=412623 RepID=UPI0036052250
MDNTTTLTFTMTAYAVLENHKKELFTLFLFLYVITVILNLLFIIIIQQNKELHLPMNVFTCMLCLNEIYGSTALLPAIMSLLMSATHEVPVAWCKAQVYFLHTYGSNEFSVLAVMGYDRYVAICHPLHYHSIMSTSKMSKLIALAVLWPCITFGCLFSLTLRLSFCGKFIPKLYCVNMELVKKSCTSVSYISIVGLLFILVLIVPQLLMIVFSYVKILRVCLKLRSESTRNGLRTCIPHLLSLMSYSAGALFEIGQTRLDMSHVAAETRIFLSLYFLVIMPVVNPLLYGLGTQRIRLLLLKLPTRRKSSQ